MALVVSAETAAHAAWALKVWRRELVRDGTRPSDELLALEAAFGSAAVRSGHERSTLGDPSAGPDPHWRRRDWLSVKEVVDSMRVSESTVRRLVKRGELASVLAGRRRLVHADAVASYGRSTDA